MDQNSTNAQTERPYFTVAAVAGPSLALATLNPTFVFVGAIAALIGIIGSWVNQESSRWWGTVVGGTFLGMIVYYTFIRADPVQQDIAQSTPQATHDLKWHYSYFDDPIRRIEGSYARTDSPTDFELQRPYDGPNNATFYIGLLAKDWAGVLQIRFKAGQPLCGYHHRIVVKLDGDERKTFEMNCTLPSDGTTTTINLKPGTNDYNDRVNDDEAQRFFRVLRTARRMDVALEFYQSGAQNLAFNLAGLELDKIEE